MVPQASKQFLDSQKDTIPNSYLNHKAKKQLSRTEKNLKTKQRTKICFVRKDTSKPEKNQERTKSNRANNFEGEELKTDKQSSHLALNY